MQAAPARQTQSVPAPQPETRPQTRPVQASRQETPQPRQATPAREDTLGDTTRTSIIKNFLLKMAPGADHADTHALNEGKEQFQQFFGKTAAVLPDSDGKLRDPSRRKRGFFGLGKAEDTGEFVPINVSLGGRREEPAPQPEPEPEEEPYTEPAPQPEEAYYDADEVDDGEAAAPAYQAPAPQPEPEEPTVEKTVYHSHHAGAALPNHTATTGGITLSGIRAALRGSSSGATGTVYRKKRNTIEFTPGQKLARPPEQVQHPPALDVELDDIEHGLLHLVGGGAGVLAGQLAQASASGGSCDYSHSLLPPSVSPVVPWKWVYTACATDLGTALHNAS